MRGFTQIATTALFGAAALFALAAPASANPNEPIFQPLRFDPVEALRQDAADAAAGAAEDAPKELAAGFNDLMSTVYDISNNSVEVRIGAYAWQANIDVMESMAIQKDMKAARAKGFIDITQATTRDLEDDFGIDLDPTLIINPFVDWRIDNHVVRMSWWQYQTDGQKIITEDIAFGDHTYVAGDLIEGDLTLWDTKLGYEYRVLNNDYGQLFTGISLVYLRSAAEFHWNMDAYGFDRDGCPIDSTLCAPGTETPGKPSDTEEPFEHFGLAAISIRIEGKLTEGVYLWYDGQTLAIPFAGGIAYSYADVKFGMSIEISRFTRLSVGYRYYDARLWLDDFGSKETDFYGRFKLTGGFAAVAVVFP